MNDAIVALRSRHVSDADCLRGRLIERIVVGDENRAVVHRAGGAADALDRGAGGKFHGVDRVGDHRRKYDGLAVSQIFRRSVSEVDIESGHGDAERVALGLLSVNAARTNPSPLAGDVLRIPGSERDAGGFVAIFRAAQPEPSRRTSLFLASGVGRGGLVYC